MIIFYAAMIVMSLIFSGLSVVEIMLYDPILGVIAALTSGWSGGIWLACLTTAVSDYRDEHLFTH